MSTVDATALALQLRGYRLATAEIIYHLPDHPSLLQTFIWQHLDLAPEYPELRKFLLFWQTNLDGRLHSVRVGRCQLVRPGRYARGLGEWQLH